jgi:hypothetical protein
MTEKRIASLMPLVPETCMICGAKWMGGHERPGHRMRPGLRVFYDCGASLSVREGYHEGAFHLLLKNCWCEENVNSMDEYFKGMEGVVNAGRGLTEGRTDTDPGLP